MGRIERTQVPEFGAEIRGLLDRERATKKQREIAGIIVDEINCLVDAKSEGKNHPKEERLTGAKLRDVGYLKLYVCGESVRVYFTIQNRRMWMLHVDIGKRRTSLTEGTEKLLKQRLDFAKNPKETR